MWKNYTKCKYMFIFPLKNLARKGLIQGEKETNNCQTGNFICLSYYGSDRELFLSMWKNYTKCKYMFIFPLKNLARKGLIQGEKETNNCQTGNFICLSYYGSDRELFILSDSLSIWLVLEKWKGWPFFTEFEILSCEQWRYYLQGRYLVNI